MSQFDSFELKKTANLEQHLQQIEVLIESKRNELESLEGVKRTLESVLGIKPVQAVTRLELVETPDRRIADVA